jgi:hypothetical protein
MHTVKVRLAVKMAFLLTMIRSSGAAQVTLAQVQQMKNDASTRMEYENLRFVGMAEPRNGYSLALAYGRQGQIHEISGTSDGYRVSIPFGEIEFIEAVSKEKDAIRLKVTRFPMISPADLLRLKPRWSDLKSRRAVTNVTVPLRDAHGDSLVWQGRPSQYGNVENLGAVEGTATGVSIGLGLPLNATWWAMPWIVDDPLCTPCKSLPALYGHSAARKPGE